MLKQKLPTFMKTVLFYYDAGRQFVFRVFYGRVHRVPGRYELELKPLPPPICVQSPNKKGYRSVLNRTEVENAGDYTQFIHYTFFSFPSRKERIQTDIIYGYEFALGDTALHQCLCFTVVT
jgi:hypothetical protein